jgi:import receptor subunit TOM70
VINSDYDRVIDLCTKELNSSSSSPHSIESLYLRGTFRFLYGYGEEETVADLNEVIAQGPKEYKATALIKRASYFALVDKHDKCQESFEESEKIWPENCDLFHHRGQVSWKLRHNNSVLLTNVTLKIRSC